MSAAAPARLSDTALCSLDDVDAPWPGRCVDIGGVELFVRHTPPLDGAREPALFVHGLGGSSQNWTDLAGLLRAEMDIEALDLPGFGGSGPPADRDYSVPAQVRAVIGYLQYTGRGPVHLVGNSMGGAVCVHVAAQRPDLVRTLTLISPAVPDTRRWRIHPLRHDPLLALVAVPWLGAAAVRQVGRMTPQRRAAALLAMCFAHPERLSAARREEAVAEIAQRAQVPWANDALLRATRALARYQLLGWRSGWTAIRRVRVPTLVIWGGQDKLVTPRLAGPVATAVAGARLLMLGDVGHVAMMERPGPTARAVLGLVEDRGR